MAQGQERYEKVKPQPEFCPVKPISSPKSWKTRERTLHHEKSDIPGGHLFEWYLPLKLIPANVTLVKHCIQRTGCHCSFIAITVENGQRNNQCMRNMRILVKGAL
jgi:hypothetical protein